MSFGTRKFHIYPYTLLNSEVEELKENGVELYLYDNSLTSKYYIDTQYYITVVMVDRTESLFNRLKAVFQPTNLYWITKLIVVESNLPNPYTVLYYFLKNNIGKDYIIDIGGEVYENIEPKYLLSSMRIREILYSVDHTTEYNSQIRYADSPLHTNDEIV